jgi:hypothetical protein
MHNAIKPDAHRLAAAVLGALLLAYVLHAAAVVGAQVRVAQEQAHHEQLEGRHAQICRRLGRPAGTPEHAACLAELDDLRGWHGRMLRQHDLSLL